MTADRRHLVRSPLAMRLIGGFVAVAVVAVFVLAGLTLWRTKHSVGRLARERQQATAAAIADTLGLAYQQSGGWETVDPHPAMMLAVQADASLTVVDNNGNTVELRNTMGNMPQMAANAHGPTRVASVVVDGEQVGIAHVTFVSGELAQAEMHVRDALSGTVAIGALIAALVAALVAAPIALRIVRPLRCVTDAAQRLGDGDATARAGEHRAPGEVGTLNRTFDAMAERLQANDVARRNLAADVAHELRTPLTLLQGGCEEIIDGITEPSMEHFVQMHDDVLRLRRLVDDLGTLAEADAALAGPNIAVERCDLADIAAGAADALRPLAEANQQQVHRQLEPAIINGDPARLAQIVTNLLTNAIKFTPPRSTIALTVCQNLEQREATLTVSDNGPGIPAEDRPHVFERFYRSDATRPVAGSGIGLAVVAQLVKAHGGTIEIVDTKSGTTIAATFPGA
ncbi:MAG TPA: HAMP domain-containing sensor histidine kinase [Ilumatobacteraceae bacterium]|nr:HAMP domain-containing sensor histidine kinase [Ilumatobacteraceae bacterium]